MKLKKLLGLALSGVLTISAIGCSKTQPENIDEKGNNKIVIGASAIPHAEILEEVKPILQEKGYELDIKVFDDYTLLNTALDEGSIDANFFQHVPYLEDTIDGQGLFRSNFVIFGIPITESLFGSEKVGVAALLIAVIVTLFNILSVIALETFRGGKPNFRKISIGIIKNPLIIASCLGILTLLLKIKIPTAMEKTISDVSKIATPLSLILLGASFKFDNIKKYLKQTTIAVVGKTILTPCIILPICIMFGYRGVELTTLMIIFAAPTAISSFTMAQQMDSDSDLAGQIVVFTSAFYVVTVFMLIFILKQSHLI